MNVGKTLFVRTMDLVPWTSFSCIGDRHAGNSGVRRMTCAEQLRVLAFGQLTWRESLRDIEVTRGANANKLYAIRLRHRLLIRRARKLYAGEDLGLDLNNTGYALDASTINLCLSLFDWAPFGTTNAAIKLHNLLD